MKRSICLLLLTLGCAPQVAPSPPILDSRYGPAFVASGERHGVPSEVLAVVARAMTRGQQVQGGGELGRPVTWGVMGVPDALVTEAAKTDAEANIELAAQLLSARAREAGVSSDDVRAWAPIVVAWAGITEPEAQRQFLRDEFFGPLALGSGDRDVATKQQALSPDYDLGVWHPSPNFNSRNGHGVEFVIIHTCEGGYSGCWGWLTNPAAQASAHYVVNEDGSEVTQEVLESDRAWHVAANYDCGLNNGFRCDLNGVSINSMAVGIEHAGFASQPGFPASQLDASARLVCAITQHHGIPRDRAHILGHGQMQPVDRTDPGPNWPWDDFIWRVQEACGDHPKPCDRSAGPFTFSCDGPEAGQTCVNVNEPSDPDSWADNQLCSTQDFGFRWSFAGPIDGMDCTNVAESAEPLASIWADNWFCAPKQSPWIVSYSSAGPLDGKLCVNLNEPADVANSWADNYLCFEPRVRFTQGELTFSMVGPVADQSCVSLAVPGDDDTWGDNFLCSARDLGLTFSTTGPEAGRRCVAITEGSEDDASAWANTFLCAPMDSPVRFAWSSAGPVPGQQCLRVFEHAEPVSSTWLDNWLCFVAVDTPVERVDPVVTPAEASPTRLPLSGDGARGCSESGAAAVLWLLLSLLRRRDAQRRRLT
ncbi:MAG: N-acetylmuramoyl-L-alanine amidase [Myxococcaceae bacterium]